MAEVTGRTGDFVLAPNQFVFIQDKTKGHVNAYVGPHKSTLSDNDIPVIFDRTARKFVQADLLSAVQQFIEADEGSYVVLENPAAEDKAHPALGNISGSARLHNGRKINIPGPETFALWPGQVASSIPGHRLRTNQYLVGRVYNDEAASKNWTSAVMKPAEQVPPAGTGKDGDKGGEGTQPTAPASGTPTPATDKPPTFTMGQLVIIRGTDVSFFIPPTGLEVVPDEKGQYVREAVTLERLEHCILLSESGEKRYVRGPAVVFPEPTETFVEGPGGRKFRAIELNNDMGLYIKVTADYEGEYPENGQTKHKSGDELFITGKEQSLYFPRKEHKLIKYGDKEIHYGIAIPKGEARYVLDKRSGSVELVKGPQIFLPDPRTQVIVRRVLSDDLVNLLYPGNLAAAAYNANLRSLQSKSAGMDSPLDESVVRAALGRPTTRGTRLAVAESAVEAYAGDGAIDRGTSFTPPRTITLDTKFEGAVAINVWNGYAVMIADKAGNQRVEVGPKTVLLEYDEYPVVLSLSTGKPKNTDNLVRTVYLRVKYNHITDIVELITGDDVRASVKLVWRVNFEGVESEWFSVENYVKFLCDRTRSILRGVAKQMSIQELSESYIPTIRDAILGAKPDAKDRAGLRFVENGVRIYDVEVSELVIGDKNISDMLAKVQVESVTRAIKLANQDREYQDTLKGEQLKRKTAEALADTEEHVAKLTVRKTAAAEAAKRDTAEALAMTRVHAAELALEDATRAEEAKRATAEETDKTAAELARLEAERIKREGELAGTRQELARVQQANKAEIEKLQQELESSSLGAKLARLKSEKDQVLAFEAAEQKLELEKLTAETAAAVERFKGISAEFATALQSFGNRELAQKLGEAVAPIALREGISVTDALLRIFKGTSLEEIFRSLASREASRSERD